MKIYISNTQIKLNFILLKPNDWVVLKPNMVKESKETDPEEWESVITSPLLIKQVTEYVCQQLKGTGKIAICDAPQTDSNFEKIAQKLGLCELANMG